MNLHQKKLGWLSLGRNTFVEFSIVELGNNCDPSEISEIPINFKIARIDVMHYATEKIVRLL